MSIEVASNFGLIGSGLAIGAFFGLTVIGILFVRVLDGIEGYGARIAVRWNETNAIPPV
jgi:hypothetical protein